MKPAYAICALLSVTIGTTLVLAENGIETKPGTAQPSKSIVPPNLAAGSSKTITDTTTAEPSNDTLIHETTQTPNITTSSSTPTTPTKPPITPTTTATPTTNPKTTTSNTTVPTPTSTTTSTPPKTTSHIPTTPPSTAAPGTTDASKTTAVPPPSKDRQFDGLSFFGGIVLTTCLMAIAAFSWKFYRQCKEGNYRTL